MDKRQRSSQGRRVCNNKWLQTEMQKSAACFLPDMDSRPRRKGKWKLEVSIIKSVDGNNGNINYISFSISGKYCNFIGLQERDLSSNHPR